MLVLVCHGPECGERRGSAAVRAAIEAELGRRPQGGVEVRVDGQCCFGRCASGPNVMVRELPPGEDRAPRPFAGASRGGTLYNAVVPSEAARIVEEHVLGGRIIAAFRRRGPA